MAKITLEQKRLQTLKRQLYGKEVTDNLQSSSRSHSFTATNTPASIIDESNYLKKDLLKILAISLLALAIQFLIFSNLSKIPFKGF